MSSEREKAELLVDNWLMNDFAKSTRTEALQLLKDEKFLEITNRLGGTNKLTFGTAGLRARMGPGYDRMNCLTVLQTTQGLAAYLKSSQLVDLGSSSVVIGFDGRHNSESFAHVTAAVFLSRGIKVHFLQRCCPTPLTPFLIPRVGALCGIQITASHNPKDDNGYKLYWSNGAQIVPPLDSAIADSIEKHGRELSQSIFKILDPETLRVKRAVVAEGLLVDVADSTISQYVEAIANDVCRTFSANGNDENVKFSYTAMHGVGYECLSKIFERFGFRDVLFPVVAQMTPDPEFPTVKFPNPEEKGALKLAIADANKNGCDVVLANDPDADRFTAAERQADGSWYQFTGDELGLLFADWQMLRTSLGPEETGLLVNSVVSSRMVSELVKARTGKGNIFAARDCLTGFKWIANESIRARSDPHVKHLLGYEEAIGYQLSSIVPDKDGMSAACVWAEMVCYWKSCKNFTMKDRLTEISQTEIGYFVTKNGYFIIDDPSVTKAVFADFRARSDLTQLGGYQIIRIRDVTTGTDSDSSAAKLPATPDAEMIQIFFQNGAVVTVRASGTEPKVKYYSEMSSKASREQAASELERLVIVIKRDFYQPTKFDMREQPTM